jgi:hypothetical protein
MASGCRTGGLSVKVYYLSNDDGGLIRRQDNELIPFRDAEGFRCMSKEDFDTTVNFVRSCLERRP